MRHFPDYKIGVLDSETDPFSADRIPVPFVAGFYADGIYLTEWGENCIQKLMRRIVELPGRYLIYVHNGGRFDFYFMLDEVGPEPLIINGRLVEWIPKGQPPNRPRIVFRDSIAIIPISLDHFGDKQHLGWMPCRQCLHQNAPEQKKCFVCGWPLKRDYRIMEEDTRELPENKPVILGYLHQDCIALHKLVSRFVARFSGEHYQIPISVGQAAMCELLQFHSFESASEVTDLEMRPFYMGGRVQCFHAGIIAGPWYLYDLNSSYPKAMRDFQHPLTDVWEEVDAPPRSKRSVWFAEVTGRNHNAIAMRFEDKTEFDVPVGRFFACSHELVPAIELGRFEPLEWHRIWKPAKVGSFKAFVDYWYAEKVNRKLAGDKTGETFAKFMLNSCYGKFGQNPRDFREYEILVDPFGDRQLKLAGFEPDVRLSDDPFLEIWSRPAPFYGHGFYNVGIAASITSASRSLLLRGLSQAEDPAYCDTDSVICRKFNGPVSSTELGHWKFEGSGEFLAIAGRKTYCLYNGSGPWITPVKWASKGGDLDPREIIEIAKGGEIEKTSDVPTFSLKRGIQFQSRTFRKTVDDPRLF